MEDEMATELKETANEFDELPEEEPPAVPQGAEWNPVEKVILERRSVRKYKDKQVPENMIRRILEAGRFAPSAGNCQPWKFIVIRDKEIIDEMERDVGRMSRLFKFLLHWRSSPLGRRVPWLLSQLSIRIMHNELHPIPFGAIALVAEGKLMLFHDAPTVILLLSDKRGISRPQLDMGCCGTNMILAAHSMGLGTCWVGFVKLLTFTPKWKKRLGIEFPYELVEGISVGYPVGNPDGMIPRETVETDWYENGEKRTIY